MIRVISGTNRPGSNTLSVARRLQELVVSAGSDAEVLDLQELPQELFAPEAYAHKPAAFERFQEAIDASRGLITVVPEYNGSFPGVLKYFIDMLAFPRSLTGMPCAFVGLSAGRWGGLRAVEQLEQVFLYRHAQPYGRRVFLPEVLRRRDGPELIDAEREGRLRDLAQGFVAFTERMRA